MRFVAGRVEERWVPELRQWSDSKQAQDVGALFEPEWVVECFFLMVFGYEVCGGV